MNAPAKRAKVGDLQDAWRWFVVLGASLALFGVLASLSLVFRTVATANVVGVMMVFGGVVLVVHALGVRQWGWFYFWLASGLLYLLAGSAVLYDPRFALTTITLFLAADFVVIGFLRLWVALGARDAAGWTWLIAACGVTLSLGAIFALRQGISAIWVLVLALAIDLVMPGGTFAAMGLSLGRQKAGAAPVFPDDFS